MHGAHSVGKYLFGRTSETGGSVMIIYFAAIETQELPVYAATKAFCRRIDITLTERVRHEE